MPKFEYQCELCGHMQTRITKRPSSSLVCPKCRHGAYRIKPKASLRTVVSSFRMKTPKAAMG